MKKYQKNRLEFIIYLLILITSIAFFIIGLHADISKEISKLLIIASIIIVDITIVLITLKIEKLNGN